MAAKPTAGKRAWTGKERKRTSPRPFIFMRQGYLLSAAPVKDNLTQQPPPAWQNRRGAPLPGLRRCMAANTPREPPSPAASGRPMIKDERTEPDIRLFAPGGQGQACAQKAASWPAAWPVSWPAGLSAPSAMNHSVSKPAKRFRITSRACGFLSTSTQLRPAR